MKTIYKLTIATLMAASFTACGGNGSDDEPTATPTTTPTTTPAPTKSPDANGTATPTPTHGTGTSTGVLPSFK